MGLGCAVRLFSNFHQDQNHPCEDIDMHIKKYPAVPPVSNVTHPVRHGRTRKLTFTGG